MQFINNKELEKKTTITKEEFIDSVRELRMKKDKKSQEGLGKEIINELIAIVIKKVENDNVNEIDTNTFDSYIKKLLENSLDEIEVLVKKTFQFSQYKLNETKINRQFIFDKIKSGFFNYFKKPEHRKFISKVIKFILQNVNDKMNLKNLGKEISSKVIDLLNYSLKEFVPNLKDIKLHPKEILNIQLDRLKELALKKIQRKLRKMKVFPKEQAKNVLLDSIMESFVLDIKEGGSQIADVVKEKIELEMKEIMDEINIEDLKLSIDKIFLLLSEEVEVFKNILDLKEENFELTEKQMEDSYKTISRMGKLFLMMNKERRSKQKKTDL